MRVATWNVNSLNARLAKLSWWLERAQPDVLLLQETKVSDDHAPHEELARHGYELAHHGEGRWNGVAIASRVGLSEVVVNFGAPVTVVAGSADHDDQPLEEARMISARCGGVYMVSIYAPNGRALDSSFYWAKLAWFARLERWLRDSRTAADQIVLGGDFNVAPTDVDVWDAALCHGGTHVSNPERQAFQRLCDWGLVDVYRRLHPEPGRYSWWDYRAGHFHKNFGMRIDHLLVTHSLAERVVWTEIDREARKGKPTPSDHAPVLLDLDRAGKALDVG
jgi:exodeoxyribonuclease III